MVAFKTDSQQENSNAYADTKNRHQDDYTKSLSRRGASHGAGK